MTPYQASLAVFLEPSLLHCQAPRSRHPHRPESLANETCAGCFAYLEFAPSLEPESHAMRGQATETSALLPPASEPSDVSREQAVLLTSKQ